MNDRLTPILRELNGVSISLANSHIRYYDRAFYSDQFDSIYIAGNPTIIETCRTPFIKCDICAALNSLGVPVVPAEGVGRHLCEGLTKNISPNVLVEALKRCNIPFVRVVSFGAKLGVSHFVDLEDDLRSCDAALFNYPGNMWDIGLSRREILLPVLKLESRYLLPHGAHWENYILFTPFDQRSQPEEFLDQPVKQVKYYLVHFHFLRCSHSFHLNSIPSSGQSAYRKLENIKTVVERMAANVDKLGGLRTEARIESLTLHEAVAIFMDVKPWDVERYVSPATMAIKGIDPARYVMDCFSLLERAKRVLSRLGLTKHSPHLSLDMKKVFGDLKSMLGYTTHTVPRADPIDPAAWWKLDLTPLPPLVTSMSEQTLPPPSDHDDDLKLIVENCRRPTGQRRIRWKDVHQIFSTRHPELRCTLNQVKNRYHTITRIGQ